MNQELTKEEKAKLTKQKNEIAKALEIVEKQSYFFELNNKTKAISIYSEPSEMLKANKCGALKKLVKKFKYTIQYAIK